MRIVPFVLVLLPAVSAEAQDTAQCLLAAYPDQICGLANNVIKWCDGTEMTFDDGKVKDHQTRLNAPDLEDQVQMPYPTGPIVAPDRDVEPGRVRYEPFFKKMYGGTRAQVKAHITTIRWPIGGARVRVTTVNGVHEKLLAVGNELAQLPRRFRKYLRKRPQTWVFRTIRGTRRLSAHSFGIAVDIAVKHSDYWRWSRKTPLRYRNRIPQEIVRIFERHGFIWGGRWYRYDTMHFEYRPELLVAPCVRRQ